ncbi:TonB-dependent receptor [Tenacibaculum sp. Bg11-29]|uniref:TonB-dependent receptor n=1 Tax=Tenacibaculum sp. Bg11-29 TaxID=2058306 RepID=UPI000C3481DB|nr:TonB-dependent receptor [Tenacibaculum sp. Bg11-29]PKH49924.1 TonB-dependent receptor [Tenacibaculum sp. Bg11-29]
MKKIKFLIAFLTVFQTIYSQEESIKQDTLETHNFLKEIIIISKKRKDVDNKKYIKPLSSLDQFLEESSKINMIKRGNYAWEPTINNMISDRISVTIDGMQIFGACTDKMDPITSYVDISNLEKVAIFSGQHGNENGQTIGGAIDLKLDKNNFTSVGSKLVTGFDLGYESNSNTKIIGIEANYNDKKLFLNTDFIKRTAGNYFDGNNNEVLFSQYNKYNFSAITGYKLSSTKKIGATLIYDEATDVGYPALPMDVSLAKAIIGSINYEYSNEKKFINDLETKIYANAITHIMDDTKRPNVAIHMDMPGWSDTYGFYTKIKAKKNNHSFLANFNGYYNKSLAEMTMYPPNSTEKLMFMLTWPDVRTLYSGIYLEDKIFINKTTSAQFSARIGFQNNNIASDFGLGSLQIFYPNLKASKNRFLPSISAQITHKKESFTYTSSIGYGERAPSVSEGYGNFLFNSFDNFDYIGNPNLKNEKSLEFNAKIAYNKNKFKFIFDNSLFYISDYIIGKINTNYTPMVIGADGVKVYSSLDNILQFNTSLNTTYKFNSNFTLNGSVGYNYGKEINGENLPLISPISYKANLVYTKGFFNSKIEVVGAGTQNNFSKIYGEDKTKEYTIMNLDAGYKFYINNDNIILKTGVENVFNTYYSTYSDWKNIPRMGRNIFVNLSYILK